MNRIWLSAALACLSASPAWADPPPAAAPPYRPGVSLQPVTLYDKDGNLIGGPGAGLPTTPTAVTRTRTVCILPQYSTGGTAICTTYNADGTTTVANNACAANTACLISLANAARKTARATVRTLGATCDWGYSSAVAPGYANGIDGPGTTDRAQGGSDEEIPAHGGAYFAACTIAATFVFSQGQ